MASRKAPTECASNLTILPSTFFLRTHLPRTPDETIVVLSGRIGKPTCTQLKGEHFDVAEAVFEQKVVNALPEFDEEEKEFEASLHDMEAKEAETDVLHNGQRSS